MYDVEKYMADHRFSEDDKKRVRDFLSQKQFEEAFFLDSTLHYVHGGGEYIVPYRVLGLQNYYEE